MKITEYDRARFWSKVDVSTKNKCWNWKSPNHEFGYGQFRFNGKSKTSHRVALIFWSGKEEKNLFVLHSCDNPRCCNPNHLRWGTAKDNFNDCVERGRNSPPPKNNINPPIHYGTNNNKAVLNEKKVVKIREEYQSGNCSQKYLSKKWGVSKSTIAQIVNYKTWKHVSSCRKEGIC